MNWLYVLSSSQALGLSTKKAMAVVEAQQSVPLLKPFFEHGKDADN